MSEIKTFNIRLPRELWAFLKKRAAEKDTSMGEILIKSVRKMKDKHDKKSLTDINSNV
jgi:hypothetical protein